MGEGSFKHWDDPLKHSVRLDGWLPLCRDRLTRIREKRFSRGQTRRLRYFTFCATTAIDVLMLDVHNIIHQGASGRFDNVTFFDYEPEHVIETLKRIPGAVGFSGDFINTVLYEDIEQDDVDVLAPLQNQEDKVETRRAQVIQDQHRRFKTRFPFDVLNFDLEEFLFKPNDPRPGKVVRALKRIFQWQQQAFTVPQSRANQYLNEFSLMFTTQIGPPNISDEYLLMLQKYVESNLQRFDELSTILTGRIGHNDVLKLRNDDFDTFFKLAMPKVLLNILMENDWYVDPDRGIIIYEFERPSNNGNYVMLHLIMDVKRKNPPIDRRDPGEDCPDALEAYEDLTFRLFEQESIHLIEDQLDKVEIEKSLANITGRAKKYMAGEFT